LIVVDDGEFEDRNLMAQHVSPGDLGWPKVDVAERVAAHFRVAMMPVTKKFTAASDFESCLIVDAFDNIEARFLAHVLAQTKGVSILHLSISPAGFGLVEWNDDWTLNPAKQLAPVDFTQVEIDPCELVKYMELGVKIAMRAAVCTTDYLASGETKSYHLTDMETQLK
jgi:hypothetical protein